ncbi:MAG TPA: DUF1501 domain-containing protein [Blastocatellia bacterium]|jgi:uncharacterized protein (DUF1501 family)|nr:DUF1501 domain-containing protein [Blastocatellia bacterium]
MAITRRFFLKSSGLALASFAAAPPFLRRTALAQTAGGAGTDRPIIIAIFQRGAADGVSMVVPFGDKSYSGARPQIAVPAPKAGDVDAAIDLDGFFGLHPALAPFRPLYSSGHLAVVHAVGSPDNTRSHFDAQDYMESGTPGSKSTPDGWLNRYIASKKDPKAPPFRAVALSGNLPRTLMGKAPALAMTSISDFGVRAGAGNNQVAQSFEALYAQQTPDMLYGTGKEAFEAVKMLKKANPRQYAQANGASYPRTPYGQALLQIAQLIKADIGLEVAFTDIGGWDTHANQGSSRGQLSNRLREFSQGIEALYRDLGDRMRNVVILTMTEFGRTIRQNGSGGTDHGHASVSFALGGPVKGGKVYGKWPGLAPEELYEGRDLALTTDFRDVFAEVAASHLRAADLKAIFPGFNPNPANFRGFIRG